MVGVIGEAIEVERIELVAHWDHDPELLVHGVERVGHLDEQIGDRVFALRIHLLPIDDDAAGLRRFELGEEIDDELVLAVLRSHGKALDRLRLPLHRPPGW